MAFTVVWDLTRFLWAIISSLQNLTASEEWCSLLLEFSFLHISKYVVKEIRNFQKEVSADGEGIKITRFAEESKTKENYLFAVKCILNTNIRMK